MRHGALCGLVDALQAAADDFRVVRVVEAGIGHEFAQAPGVGVTHAQGFDPSRAFVQFNRRVGQHRQQAGQIACGFEVELAFQNFSGHAANPAHRLCHLALVNKPQRVHDLRKAPDAMAVGLSLKNAAKISDAAFDALVVFFVEVGKGQQHQRLVIEQLGFDAQDGGARQHLHRSGFVAHVIGHHAELLQPDDGVGGQRAGRSVGFNGLGEVACLHLGAAQHVIGVGKRGVFADQALQRGHGAPGLAGFHLRSGHTEPGPGNGPCLEDGLEQEAGLFVVTQAKEQFRADACCIQPVGLALYKLGNAQFRGSLEIVLFYGVENRAQVRLALACRAQPLKQRQRREGFEQIAIKGRLGGFGHGSVTGFGRHHEKNGGERQQLRTAQVVKQGLPRALGG